MFKIHTVSHWKKGPKANRQEMVQASFTDETGHHTNHFSLREWERICAEREEQGAEVKDGYQVLDISPKSEDS